MDYAEELLKDHSKEVSMAIANDINGDVEKFKKLLNIFLSKDKKLAQRSALAFYACDDLFPEIIKDFQDDLMKALPNPPHNAIRRASLRALSKQTISEENLGMCADLCFKFLNDGEEEIAIKVWAMEILKQIVNRIPELKEELRFSLEEQLPYQSAGFKNRAQKILRVI